MAIAKNRLAGYQSSSIMDIAAAAELHQTPIKMWFGESDLDTPANIKAAAEKAMRDGMTFYAHRRGVRDLRQAIASYLTMLYDIPVDLNRITVAASGMNAIMVALQTAIGDGGNVVIVSPIWPNIINAVSALGADHKLVSLKQKGHTWDLDLDELFSAVDSSTAAIFIASPSNPTGWVCDPVQQRALLDFCTERQIYLIADEVYQRIYFSGDVAPSFLTASGQSDAPLIIVNSFSKNWAMTGWRLGWLIHPDKDASCIGELNAVNNTGASTFIQYAGIEAICRSEDFVSSMKAYCKRGRDQVHNALNGMSQINCTLPEAGMYYFFKLDGIKDATSFAMHLAKNTGVGVAPGSAFGAGHESYLRLCFALSEKKIDCAMDRLTNFIGKWYS